MAIGPERPEAGAAAFRVNGRLRVLGARRLPELLRELGYDAALPGLAVARNGEIVCRRDWAERVLEPGDEIEIVGAVQGG